MTNDKTNTKRRKKECEKKMSYATLVTTNETPQGDK
jgi:hypothetical protein|tara:strand:+ start:4155 stop:4262 length:108 start_codon:yes stop_codon:yes gene_type:complete